MSPSVAARRLSGLPRSAFGAALAHFGLGVTLLGIVSVSAFSTEAIRAMRPGDIQSTGGYAVRFDGIVPREGSNYSEEVGRFTLLTGQDEAATMESAKRFFPARQTPTTEAGIHTHWFSQTYIALGDATPNGRVVRLWHKPLVTLIWIGCVVMAAGGGLSLADRRLRVGAPARAKGRRRSEAAPA